MINNHFKNHLHHILAVATAFVGVVSLIAKPQLNHSGRLKVGVSFEFLHDTRIAVILLSTLLLYLSIQLWNRKRRAWIIAITSLSLLIVLSVIHHHPVRLALSGVLLPLLLIFRNLFYIKSDNINLRHGIGSALAIILISLAYGTIGFYLLERRDFGTDFNIIKSAQYTIDQITFQSNDLLHPRTEHAKLLIDSLRIMSVGAITLVVASLFRPLKFLAFHSKADKKRASKIIKRFGNSSEDYFKLYPEHNKHYYFSNDNNAVIAYTISKGIALVIDGPTGKASSVSDLLSSFTKYVEAQGWSPSIIHADDKTALLSSDVGYKQIYIGSEAVIDCGKFFEKTKRSKHFRYVSNKSVRENLRVEHWPAPLTSTQLETLEQISNSWLDQGKHEYTFMMGPFDEHYLKKCDVSVLLQNDNPIAYANLIPELVKGQRSIDHMRHTKQIPSVGMHYLLQEMVLNAQKSGATTFNLGLSPLSKLDDKLDKNLPEKFLKLVKDIGSKYYSFRGLEQFKNKFEPDWQPRYICYKGSPTNLVKISSSLSKAMKVPRLNNVYVKKWHIIGLAIMAGLSYTSFPLGYFLDLNNSVVVSKLGADGAPFAEIFNLLDVISGLLLIAVYLLGRKLVKTTDSYLAIKLLAASGFGGLMAALVTLPSHNDPLDKPFTIVHILLSALNVGGIIIASFIMIKHLDSKRRLLLILMTFYIVSLGIALVYSDNIIGAIAQRIQIVMTALCMVFITITSLSTHDKGS